MFLDGPRVRNLLVTVLIGTAVFFSAALGQGNRLVVGMSVDPPNLNPMQQPSSLPASAIAVVNEKFFYLEDDGRTVIPWLAVSNEWIDDLTLELELRQGVTFTNGEPWNAEAAKFTLETFVASPVFDHHTSEWKDASFDVVDSHTIRISLQRPVPYLTSVLAQHPGIYVVPPAYYAQVGAEQFGVAPIGTGPFILTDRVFGEELVYQRNPDWWRGTHDVDTLVFRIMPDDAARAAAVLTGELDIAVYMSGSVIERINQQPNVSAVEYGPDRRYIVSFNAETGDWPDGSPLNDSRVRLALNYAVDLDAIVSQVFEGRAVKQDGQYLSQQQLGYNPEVQDYGYDPELARQLLAEAGYPNGFKLVFAYPVARYLLGEEFSQVVAAYLNQVGIETELRPLEWGELVRLRTLGANRAQSSALGHLVMFGFGHAQDPWDAYTFLKESWQARGVFMLEFSDEWLALMAEVGTVVDPARREHIFQELAEIDHANPPMIFGVIPTAYYGVNDRVDGFIARRDELIWLYDVTLND